MCVSDEWGLKVSVCAVGDIRTQDAAATCLANCSISLSRMGFFGFLSSRFLSSCTLSWEKTES